MHGTEGDAMNPDTATAKYRRVLHLRTFIADLTQTDIDTLAQASAHENRAQSGIKMPKAASRLRS
jgi:hypothetical protein